MSELGLRDGMGGAKEKADKDALWIGELTDSLTIAIALREWDKAVLLVEEGSSTLNFHLIAPLIFNLHRTSKIIHHAVFRAQIKHAEVLLEHFSSSSTL